MHDTYGYSYILWDDHRDPRTATVQVDDLSASWWQGTNNKKIFSFLLTPVLDPTQDHSSRDRKNSLRLFMYTQYLKGSNFRKKLPFSLARLTRIRIFFAICFFFYVTSVLKATARQLLKKSRLACEQQHTRKNNKITTYTTRP